MKTKAKKVTMIRRACGVCGNVSSYDTESLKGSTWKINGTRVVLCCPCEDELYFEIGRSRAISAKLMENIVNQLDADSVADLAQMLPFYKIDYIGKKSKKWKVALLKKIPFEY